MHLRVFWRRCGGRGWFRVERRYLVEECVEECCHSERSEESGGIGLMSIDRIGKETPNPFLYGGQVKGELITK